MKRGPSAKDQGRRTMFETWVEAVRISGLSLDRHDREEGECNGGACEMGW